MEASASSLPFNSPLPSRIAARTRALPAVAPPSFLPLRPRRPPPISLDVAGGAAHRAGATSGRWLKKPLAFPARASGMRSPEPSHGGGVGARIVVGSAVTVALAVANRVLYKLALVPMKDYPFFMAQMTTFG